MEPDRRSAAAVRRQDSDSQGDSTDTKSSAAEASGAAAPDAEAAAPREPSDPNQPVQLDPLEYRIRQQEEALKAHLDEGREAKAERAAQRLSALKAQKEERDKAKCDQELLEAADALPDSGEPAAAAEPQQDNDTEVLPPASPSRLQARHWAVALSFVVMVLVPAALAAWYLWERATDRYISRAGFSVRTEEIGSAIELLGGVADLSGSSSSDPAILYAYIQSQEMVQLVDDQLDLRALWGKSDSEIDPIFAYHQPGTIEDMVAYWQRVVKVYNDDSGIIELEVQAFTPEDSRKVAEVIYQESSAMINRLSAIAREDGTSYAREELDTAVEKLREARVAMTQFRNRTQIVDPSASLSSQMGIVSSLQQQLATALIDLDILKEQSVPDSDPRMVQLQRRVEVIEERIAKERRKLGIGSDNTDDPNAFANLVGEFESLQVDLQFAQESYTAARAAYEASVAEARRQSRYLAAHVNPTLPQRAELPNRATLLSLVMLFSFLTWAMVVLTAYALRDRN